MSASTLKEIALAFIPLVFTSFGGPQAHIGMFMDLFVVRFKWLPEQNFTQLFAISQSLPGPASTQMAFAIAVTKGGAIGGILAFCIWSLPCAIVMTLFAVAISGLNDNLPSWLYYLENGLGSAALGLVAVAGYKLGTKILNDPVNVMIGVASASLAVNITHFPWLYPILMFGGGLSTVIESKISSFRSILKPNQSPIIQEAHFVRLESGDDIILNENDRGPQLPEAISEISGVENNEIRISSAEREPFVLQEAPSSPSIKSKDGESNSLTTGLISYSHKWGYLLFGIWGTFLAFAIIVRAFLQDILLLEVWATLYFVGSIIFGGGPVVIPLLQSYVVSLNWLSNQEFLLGIAIINALPGPNFNIGPFCGALAFRNSPLLVIGAIFGWIGVFSQDYY